MMIFGGICFITDRRLYNGSIEDMVKKILDAGIKWIQYREKELSRKDIYYQAEKLRKITKDYDAIFIVNDHVDIALAVDADGVHLGQEDLPLIEARKIMKKKIIGISTHNLKQAKDADKKRADYIGFGPIFQTSTKNAGKPKGLQFLEEVIKAVSIPVVAIGGIRLENVKDVLKTNVSAVAIASGILSKKDIFTIAREFVKIILYEKI